MSSELGLKPPHPTSIPPLQRPKNRVTFCGVSPLPQGATPPHTNNRRLRSTDSDFRPRRKRSSSFSGNEGGKRPRRGPIGGTKFLVGGSITDPLNLEGLNGDEDSQGSEPSSRTSSNHSRVVKVIVPSNINDPLNLNGISDDEHEFDTCRYKKRRKSRKRKRRNSEPSRITTDVSADEKCAELSTSCTSEPTLSPSRTNLEEEQFAASLEKRLKSDSMPVPNSSQIQHEKVLEIENSKTPSQKIQPLCTQPKPNPTSNPTQKRVTKQPPSKGLTNLKFNPKGQLFQYGNYSQYYGYRNPGQVEDTRLDLLQKEWVEGKDILDIGCNIGHITLTVARDFKPKSIVGIDIDKKLISIAQKNIKHYIRQEPSEEACFPRSMRLLYGPLKAPLSTNGNQTFPHNVKFYQANYVMENDALLETVKPEFDVILCLSVTKWIHLNWGDTGLKRFFRRIYNNLRPNGKLVLEPQLWQSYKKKKKVAPQLFENYNKIKFYPKDFGNFLLKEVGFASEEKISIQQHSSRGFQRPVFVYKKSNINYTKCQSPPNESTSQFQSEAEHCDDVSHDEAFMKTSAELEGSKPDTEEGEKSTKTVETTHLCDKINKGIALDEMSKVAPEDEIGYSVCDSSLIKSPIHNTRSCTVNTINDSIPSDNINRTKCFVQEPRQITSESIESHVGGAGVENVTTCESVSAVPTCMPDPQSGSSNTSVGTIYGKSEPNKPQTSSTLASDVCGIHDRNVQIKDPEDKKS